MKKKILLIEDDLFLSKIFSNRLIAEGFEAIVALDGVEGLEKIKNSSFDLILLDLILPKKSGFEVLEEMRMNDELKKIPVVILTNLEQDVDIEKGKALGAVDYLIKANFSIKEVIDKVRFHLASHKP